MTDDEYQATSLPRDQTWKNIRFLRKSICLSIAGLAALIEIDPINLYQYEKDDYKFSPKKSDDLSDIIDISNYFAIKLDLLVFNDVEKEELIDPEWFKDLKNELNGGVKADRKNFRKEVIEYEEFLPDESTREDSARGILKQMQQLKKIQDRYHNLRDAEKINKIDFFENQ